MIIVLLIIQFSTSRDLLNQDRHNYWFDFLIEGYNNPYTMYDNSLVYFNYTKTWLEEILALINNKNNRVEISIIYGNQVICKDHNYNIYRYPILNYEEIQKLEQVFKHVLVELIRHFEVSSEKPRYDLYQIAFDNRKGINGIEVSLEYEDLNVYLENGKIDEDNRLSKGVFVSIQIKLPLEKGLKLYCNFLNSSGPTEPQTHLNRPLIAELSG